MHLGTVSEISDIHGGLLMAQPALHHARRCEFTCVNAAGRQLVHIARVSELVLGTGRVILGSALVWDMLLGWQTVDLTIL